MIHLRYSASPTYTIVSVRFEELQDKELLDHALRLCKEQKIEPSLRRIEAVAEVGTKQTLDVLDIGRRSIVTWGLRV